MLSGTRHSSALLGRLLSKHKIQTFDYDLSLKNTIYYFVAAVDRAVDRRVHEGDWRDDSHIAVLWA